MGDKDGKLRHNLLKRYQVNARLMAKAKPDALFMHCLPAHRGEEVTEEVMDGPQSVVFDEAENRLHAQKGILAWCLQAPRDASASDLMVARLRASLGEHALRTSARGRLSAADALNIGAMNQPHIDIPVRAPSATSTDDTVLPFEIGALDLRGRVVRLGPAVDNILVRPQLSAAGGQAARRGHRA